MAEAAQQKRPAGGKPKRRPIPVTVEAIERLTPHMVRVVFGGEALEGFPVGEFSDHYVKLQFVPEGAGYSAPFDPEEVKASHPKEHWPRVRSYSVRAFDPAVSRLTIDFLYHGEVGLTGPWLSRLREGDVAQLLGPGGDYAPDLCADWHLMVGDECVVPSIAAALERLPAGARAIVLIECGGPGDELPLESEAEVELRWLRRPEGGSAADSPLIAAVAELEFPPGTPQVYLHGEATAVREIRRHLVRERGLDSGAMSASGYWKRQHTDEDWRAFKPEWKRLVEQDERG